MPTPHNHADLIKQWVDDTSQPVWLWDRVMQRWEKTIGAEIARFPDATFSLGEKPTQPPRKPCKLGGLEFPQPEKAVLDGVRVYCATVDGSVRSRTFDSADGYDLFCVNSGLLHLSRSAAERHSQALLAANLAAIRDTE